MTVHIGIAMSTYYYTTCPHRTNLGPINWTKMIKWTHVALASHRLWYYFHQMAGLGILLQILYHCADGLRALVPYNEKVKVIRASQYEGKMKYMNGKPS